MAITSIAIMSSKETLTFQPPHTINPQEIAFVESLTKEENELHLLATQMLGSSYFVGKTHAYNKWVAKQKETTSLKK
jgi:hypothetical protein